MRNFGRLSAAHRPSPAPRPPVRRRGVGRARRRARIRRGSAALDSRGTSPWLRARGAGGGGGGGGGEGTSETSRERRGGGVAASSPPAHLRARDAPGTAEDVDKAVRRFLKIFADAGVAVSLRRQAPFKYVLQPTPNASETRSHSSASKPPRGKMVMIKLEQHRLVVHRGGANRAVISRAGLANRIVAPRDLADEVLPYASPHVAPRRAAKLAPGLGPNRDWLSPANAGGLAGGTPFSGSVPQPPPHAGGMNVRSDMTFVPPPAASRRGANDPFGSSPSPSPSKKLDAVFGSLPDARAPAVGGFGSAPRPAGLRPFLHLEGSPRENIAPRVRPPSPATKFSPRRRRERWRWISPRGGKVG